jgi:nondiscriminating glutamyl-tRNA synthetase
LTEQQVKDRKASGEVFTWRLRVSESRGKISWTDLVRGEQSFEATHIGDFILLREDGSATYNFASIVDDMDLCITHIMRGEDHVSNTPRQILIAEAISAIPGVKTSLAQGVSQTQFAHFPLVLGHDKSKLSKRNGARGAGDYKAMGILPAAVRNALALTCWAPQAGHEILDSAELIKAFDFSHLSRSPAVFAESKLIWINSQHLKRVVGAPDREALAAPWIEGIKASPELLRKALALIWPELSRLDEIPQKIKPLTEAEKTPSTPEERQVAEAWLRSFQSDFAVWQKAAQTESGVKGRALFMPLRKALTGQEHGLELTDLIQVLGETTVKERLKSYVTV